MTIESAREAETGKGMSNAPLGVLVELDTLISAGFNYDRYSFSIPRPDSKGRYRVYMPDPDSRMSDLAIVEEQKQRGAIKWREWYLGRVGKPTHEGPAAERGREILTIVRPENWVHSSDLERKIEGEIDRSYGGAE